MDSFYDTPRLPPSLLGTDQLLGLPEVPEISLLCPPNAPNPSQQTNFLPYNKWKLQNKENFQSTNSSILKKVRFEPPSKPPLLPLFRNNYGIDFETNKTNKQPDLNPNKLLDFNPKKLSDFNPNKKQHWDLQLDSTKQFDFNPNKQLDLSIINAPKANNNNNAVDETKNEVIKPKCYKDFLESQKITINDSVTDIFHYKPSASAPETCSDKKELVEKTTNNNEDVSAKDLLKIISQQSQQITQQNTQIMLLQQQVSELMTIQRNQIENRQAEHPCCFNKINRQKNNNEIVPVQNQIETRQYEDNAVCQQTNKNYMMMRLENDNVEKYQGFNTEKLAKMTDNYRSNISIKTSFEVVEVFRRKQEMKSTPMKNALINRALNNSSNSSPSSFESNKTFFDTSLTLKEPIKVDIPCPSPEPSIKIDMNEFDSEDSSEEDDDDDGESCEIEATFYKNLMGQVNKILRNAKTKNFPEKGDLNNRTLHRVREATLKHFKKIGVDLPSIDENFHNKAENVESNNSYSEDEVSFAVKQLLMKYLPAEYLTKVAVNEEEMQNNRKQFAGPIKNRPDFSLATIQYMQKYNLMSNQRNKIRSNEKQRYKETKSSPKVLDLTKLKQQPKLL